MDETPQHLLAYCERAGDPSLWAEPLNAATNLAFIIYAFIGYKYLRELPKHPFSQMLDIWALVISMAFIGVGSGIWHIWAEPGWTVIVDTIPIYIFINIYIFSLFRRLAAFSWLKCAIMWACFTALNAYIQQALPAQTLNGSLMYIPTFLLMLLSGIYLRISGKEHGREMIALSGLFFISLCFRTFDGILCNYIYFGTHFIWHCLNAILLYRLTMLLTIKPKLS